MKMKWISVKDRLPEDDDIYLTAWDDGTIETYQFTLFTGLIDISAGVFEPVNRFNVTHWMPLPRPPKTKELT
jgi:hypothetical protein